MLNKKQVNKFVEDWLGGKMTEELAKIGYEYRDDVAYDVSAEIDFYSIEEHLANLLLRIQKRG